MAGVGTVACGLCATITRRRSRRTTDIPTLPATSTPTATKTA